MYRKVNELNPIINFDITNDYTIVNPTGITLQSVSKWNDSKINNIELNDYGLTMFDIGISQKLHDKKNITSTNDKLLLHQIGYNVPINPTTGVTSGVTVNNVKLNVILNGDGDDRYFELNGGYFNGFFKLQGYDYEMMPPRNNGITFDCMLYINNNSHGIFLMVGGRAEDKYNPYYAGEFISGETVTLTTSNNNELSAYLNEIKRKKSFRLPEESLEINKIQNNQIDDLKNNIYAFELTDDKFIKFSYIDENGLFVNRLTNKSVIGTGFTLITFVSKPYYFYNENEILCGKERYSDIDVFVNGRYFNTFNNVPEIYLKDYHNNPDKIIGVPYNITWGGGSFGLKHSWHYDKQTYGLYMNQNLEYINDNFNVKKDISNTTDFSLNANDITFNYSVMEANHIVNTGNCYNVYYNKSILVLPNREYVISADIFDCGLFNNNGSIMLLPFSDDCEINIINKKTYNDNILSYNNENSNVFSGEHMYMKNGMMYYGETGELVDDISNNEVINDDMYITGINEWNNISTTFKIEGNDQQLINIGLLIESNNNLFESKIYVKNFTYTGQDILVQDVDKSNLLIEQLFDKPYYGGIQKLRIYDKSLTNNEIINIACNEKQIASKINKGGRLINK